MFISATINEITREIKWDKSQVAAVDGDYAVNGFKLTCLGLDPDYNLTTGAWYAVFTAQDGTSHSNPLTVSGGVVTWEFDNNINKGGAGVIKFFLYAVTADKTGKVLKRWDSAITDLRVAGTIDYENQDEEAARESEIDRLAGLVTTLTATAATINDVKTVISRITNSSPVVVATVADLSGLDTTKYQLAIVRADGYLYYYDGAAWQQGIKYGSYELDTTLTESGKAADAAAVGAEFSAIKEDLSSVQTATADDAGKALKAKTVADGKVTEWEFGEAGIEISTEMSEITPLWSQGTISIGVDTASTNRIRSDFIKPDVPKVRVVPKEGAQASYTLYSASGAYISTGGWKDTEQVVEFSSGQYIRLIARKANDDAVTPNDAPDLLSIYAYDTVGKALVAKSVTDGRVTEWGFGEPGVKISTEMSEIYPVWERGSINGSGENIDSTKVIRCDFLNLKTPKICVVPRGNAQVIYVIYSSDKTFISASSNWDGNKNIIEYGDGCYVRLIVRKSNQVDIRAEMASNLINVYAYDMVGKCLVVDSFENGKIKGLACKKMLETDPTLSVSGDAADSNSVGAYLRNNSLSDTSLWEIGSLKFRDGIEVAASNYIRTRGFIKDCTCIRAADGYVFYIYAYDQNDIYIGHFIGSNFNKSETVFYTTKYVIDNTVNYRYRIVARRSDAQDIAVSEAENIVFINKGIVPLSIDGIEHQEKELKSNVEIILNDIFGAAWKDVDAFGTVDGYAMSQYGGAVSDANSNIVKYAVTEGDVLYLSLLPGTGGTYVFQNNAVFLNSAVNPYMVGDAISGEVDTAVRVPIGASYLMVSQAKTTTTNIVRKFTGDTQGTQGKSRDITITSLGKVSPGVGNSGTDGYYSLCAAKERFVVGKPNVVEGYVYTQSARGNSKLYYAESFDDKPELIATLSNAQVGGSYARVFAVSPTHGDIITLLNNVRNTPVVYDISESLEVVVNGLDVNPVGWLSTGGFDFGIDSNDNEYLIFGEYTGQTRGSDVTGNYYYIRLWKASYPYTDASNWKVVYQAKRSSAYMHPADDGIPWHMHTCQRDPYTDIWYATTGDADTEILWMYSTDHGETWTQFHTGNVWDSQVARVINFAFAEDYVYWANDSAINHRVSRLSRGTNGLLDLSTYENLGNLNVQSTYNTCYLEYPHGLFMFDRRDTTTGANVNVPLTLQFYDIDTGKVHDLRSFKKLGTDSLVGYGCRNRFASLRQSPYDPRVGCGFEADNANMIDMYGNDGSRMWTLLFDIN